jgi:hypothetical protein
MTGVTSGAGTANPSGAPEFTVGVGQTMIKWFTSWDPIKKSKLFF